MLTKPFSFQTRFLISIYTSCFMSYFSFTSIQISSFSLHLLQNFIMVVRTSQGDEQLLFVINEWRVKFRELRSRGYNISRQVRAQGWHIYISILDRPIFPNLVRELWLNAFVPFEGNKILSFMFGHPIRCWSFFGWLPVQLWLWWLIKPRGLHLLCFFVLP